MQENENTPRTHLTLLVRLDANHQVGFAHAVRVNNLLALSHHHLDVHMVGDLDQRNNVLSTEMTYHSLGNKLSSEEEKAQATIRLAKHINADALLVDHPHLTCVSWQLFTRIKMLIIAIDDEGGNVNADFIFNGTALKEYHHYPLADTRAKIFAGANYSLVNPVFVQKIRKDINNKSLLIVIGSGDRACKWALKLTAVSGPLSNLDSSKKIMVVGPAFPKFSELNKNCEKVGIELRRGLDHATLAQMICNHSVGLITGGMIVYECLSSGMPIIVFPQEKNLPPEAQYFSRKYCLVNLGYKLGMDMGIVKNEIDEMIRNSSKRCILSQNALKMIDGQGMRRTIEIIDQQFSAITKHKVTTL